MSYQVLARKWRPQCYADVVGQPHALAVLTYSCTRNRLHHAYLFSGSRGVGKTTLARLLAKGLNCATGVTATPCRQCGPCQEIEQGRFVDLLEIDAASRTTVEDMRELLDNVHYAPVVGRFKIYLIDEVHMLSRHSFNALLKTLEEPPSHVKFLLATTDPQKLPPTLLSRCLQLHLSLLSVEKIEAQLQKIVQMEAIEAELPALRLLAEAAQGSLRDALTLMDQALALGSGRLLTAEVNRLLGTLDLQQALALVEALQRADAVNLLQRVEQLLDQGVDADSLLAAMASVVHQVALQQWLPPPIGEVDPREQRIRALAQLIDPMDLQLYYQTLLLGRKELALAPSARMGVEMTLLRAIAFYPHSDSAAQYPAQERLSNSSSSPPVSTKIASAATEAIANQGIPDERSLRAAATITTADKRQQATASIPADSASACPESNPTAQLMAIHQQLQARRQQQRSSTKSALSTVTTQPSSSPPPHGVERGELQQHISLEQRLRVAEEQKQRARQALQADEHLQRFQRDFAAEIDEASIRPLGEK